MCLAHVPDLVVLGSKPRREIERDPATASQLSMHLRSYVDALAYPPNQTFIGNLSPDALARLPRPWFERDAQALAQGPFGEIVSQRAFYGLLARANVLDPPLIRIAEGERESIDAAMLEHPSLAIFRDLGTATFDDSTAQRSLTDYAGTGPRAIALRVGDRKVGIALSDDRAEGRGDPNLSAELLLEGLVSKASAALALANLFYEHEVTPRDIDFLISCGEEACGDRYQRGAGGMAKAVGEMCGCVNASGMDIKNFCAGPASAIVTAAAMVHSGLYRRIVVIAGGSLAKLGMKMQGFLDADMPILDDCLGAMAVLVTSDDGRSPMIRIGPGAVGNAPIGASSSDQRIYQHLIQAPLDAMQLGWEDIDRFAPELHNPEIMEHAGSGDVVHKNYRMIAANAVMNGFIEKSAMESFIDRVGMVGFAPTQGHIPSGIPFLGHALRGIHAGEFSRVMFVCKASLFLNRLTELFDGVSFVVERNRAA
jgi:betaine reductase